MNSFREFVDAATAGIAECIAYAYPSGQTFRLVFTFRNGRKFTVQSDFCDENDMGFLAIEEQVYQTSADIQQAQIHLNAEVDAVRFFTVNQFDQPSRVTIYMADGTKITASSDAFPYGLAYEAEGNGSGLPEFEDTDYRPIDL